MEQGKKYNNYSEKLRSFIPKLKPGERLRFQLNVVHYDSQTKRFICPKSVAIPPIDRIYDPWARKVSGQGATAKYEGDYVDIAYIVRERPAPKDSGRDTIVDFGNVVFRGSSSGIIEIKGGNREHEKLLPFLFFCNLNSSNNKKEWFVQPEKSQQKYRLIETSKKAARDLKSEYKVDEALDIVKKMTPEEISGAASGLLAGKSYGMSPEEMEMELRKIAKNNPDKIIGLSKDVTVKTTALVEEFLKQGLIRIDKTKREVQWGDDKTKICMIKPGLTPHMSLKRYFMTDEGVEVLNSLEQQLELTKKSKKDKTEKAVV